MFPPAAVYSRESFLILLICLSPLVCCLVCLVAGRATVRCGGGVVVVSVRRGGASFGDLSRPEQWRM